MIHQRWRHVERARRKERAQATVEFALVLPLVLVVTVALAQAVLVMRDQLLVIHAAREGARAGAVGEDPVAAAHARSGSSALVVHVSEGGTTAPFVDVDVELNRTVGLGLIPIRRTIRLTGHASMRRESTGAGGIGTGG